MDRTINALVIDDSAVSRKIIMDTLDQTGLADFEYIQAEDGVDGLTKFDPEKADIIFVDMHMPRMDGRDFVEEMHKRDQKCPPIVMITAESDREVLLETLNKTAIDAFMLKPVDVGRLQIGLKTIIDAIPQRFGPSKVHNGELVPQALEQILKEMCDISLVPEEEDEEIRKGSIVFGTIAIVGEIHWSVSLGFLRETAERLACDFGGLTAPVAENDMADAIGELINIVAGRIKSLLIGNNCKHVEITLPTVIGASEFRVLVQHKNKSTSDCMHFNSSAGKLWTSVTVGVHTGIIL